MFPRLASSKMLKFSMACSLSLSRSGATNIFVRVDQATYLLVIQYLRITAVRLAPSR